MLISVCIPTYSRLSYLQETVQSVRDQYTPSYEICISIDPKPDGPDKSIIGWCEQQAQKFPNFRFRVNDRNKGLAGNWNELVQFAQGEYVIIPGDDDTLEPAFLKEVTSALQQTKADVVFTNQKFIDAKGQYLPELTAEMNTKYKRDILQSGLIAEPVLVVLDNSVPMSAAVIRRERLLQYPFDIKLNTPEQEVFLKIALAGGKFIFIDKQLANYRVHEGSATSGGLTIHYYVENMIYIAVPEKYEAAKYAILSPVITVAVNRCIRLGNKKLGRFLLDSRYYPDGKPFYKIAQRILLFAPAWVRTRF